jgi:hypothetical protein
VSVGWGKAVKTAAPISKELISERSNEYVNSIPTQNLVGFRNESSESVHAPIVATGNYSRFDQAPQIPEQREMTDEDVKIYIKFPNAGGAVNKQALIDLVAYYVAGDGEAIETELKRREENNPLFDFMSVQTSPVPLPASIAILGSNLNAMSEMQKQIYNTYYSKLTLYEEHFYYRWRVWANLMGHRGITTAILNAGLTLSALTTPEYTVGIELNNKFVKGNHKDACNSKIDYWREDPFQMFVQGPFFVPPSPPSVVIDRDTREHSDSCRDEENLIRHKSRR